MNLAQIVKMRLALDSYEHQIVFYLYGFFCQELVLQSVPVARSDMGSTMAPNTDVFRISSSRHARLGKSIQPSILLSFEHPVKDGDEADEIMMFVHQRDIAHATGARFF